MRHHPDADPDTGAVHACGHHAQCGALGRPPVLREPGSRMLCGSVRFMAVRPRKAVVPGRTGGRVIRYYGGRSNSAPRVFRGRGTAAYRRRRDAENKGGQQRLYSKERALYRARYRRAGGMRRTGLAAINALRDSGEGPYPHPILTQAGRASTSYPTRSRWRATRSDAGGVCPRK